MPPAAGGGGSVVVRKSLKPALDLRRAAVAVTYKEHGHKCERDKNRGIGEERRKTDPVHKHAGDPWRDGLCRHAGGIVEAGVLADVTAAGQLDHHREAVHVDRRPADAREREHAVHEKRAAAFAQEGSHKECGRQHDDTRKNGLFTTDPACDKADRQIGNDRRNVCDHKRAVIVERQHFARIDRVFRRYGVVSHEPEHNGGENEQQRSQFAAGEQAGFFCGFVSGRFIDVVFLAFRFHFGCKLRLIDLPQKYAERREHDTRHDGEERGVAHERVPDTAGCERHAEGKNDDTARRTHEIDDGICLAAQRLDRHIRHERNGRRTEDRHCNENDEQDAEE